MGFFNFFKHKPKEPKKDLNYVITQNGYAPTFTEFGNNIYASDIIMQAIRCKTNEFKKLNPRHIREKDGNKTMVTDSSIAQCLKRPNEIMTQTEFLEKISILLELNKNVFIYPEYYITNAGAKFYTGLYPLRPSCVEYLIDNSNRYFIHFTFANGYETILPASDVIHWRKDYGVDDYFGGSNNIYNSNKSLLKMLRVYDQITQSIAEGLKCSMSLNGIVKTNTYLEEEKLQQMQNEFNQRLSNNQSGILFADLKSDYIPLSRDVKFVDNDTMQFMYEAILRNTGVSLPILKGDYTKAQKEAFYEQSLEGDIKNLGEAFTRIVFSKTEELGYGNSIQFFPNAITFMSMENKLSALSLGLPAGIFKKDEAREMLGYEPLPNGQGQVIAQGYNSLLDENNNNKLQPQGGENNEQSN